ncbi:MAG: prolyl oligopeptidase family serine peptidase [Gemmataceae bacterium]
MPAIRLPAAILLAGLAAFATAQEKKILTHADYDNWNKSSGVSLSPDGKYVAHILTPLDGRDGTAVVRVVATGKDIALPRGGKDSSAPGSPQFSPDSKFVVIPISPTKAELDKAKAAKLSNDKMPKPVLAVVSLPGGEVTAKLPYEKSFTVGGEGSGVLIYSPPAPNDGKDEKKEETKSKTLPTKKGAEAAPPPRPRGSGAKLVIRELATRGERTLNDVSDYELTKDGKLLVYTVDAKEDAKNGVFVLRPQAQDDPVPLKSGEGRYSRLTWDHKQSRLAFFYDAAGVNTDPKVAPPPRPAGVAPGTAPPALPPKWHVFVWDRNGPAAVEVMTPATKGLKAGTRLNGTTLGFNFDGTRLHLATTVVRPPTPPAPANAPAEKVEMDLWHWKDGHLQPAQKIRGDTDRNRSFSAVLFLDTYEFRQVSDESLTVGLPAVGDWGLGQDDKPYLQLTGIINPVPRDYTLVNVKTGEKKPVLTASQNNASLSPNGKFVLHFDGKDWHTIGVEDGTKTNLTAKLPVKFWNEEDDHPKLPPPYGSNGWTSDGKFVLLYDKFDLWKIAADGTSAENVSQLGRKLNARFRLANVRADDEEDEDELRGVNLAKTLLFSAQDLRRFDAGYYRMAPGNAPKPILGGPHNHIITAKAKKADAYLVTRSSFYEHPDHYVTDSSFAELRQATDINPAIRQYNWGRAELVHYTSADGLALSGVLVKPENFDAKKKYPMIVYIYERLAPNVHQFRIPNVTAGQVINPTFYASNGYLVLMPDIAYKTGSPGQSAIKCVLPAIQAVVDQGIVDEKAIGINGQSWGGYQIAYMVTQTNRFKAAVAGAPVANMVSAYDGIRWGTGLTRQFQYEHDQSRIGDTLWRAPMKFIENSPIFMADRVETPLMMIHNDQDDAVPWYQGIEYFLALRRLGKECYLLNYNGEKHNLTSQTNARDFAVRMFQFFEHHLKGKPAPEWMVKGVPFTERDKEKESIKKLLPMPKK